MSPGKDAPPEYGLAEALTPREIEVLKLIADGHSTKGIAERLGVRFKTAACHRSRILAKVGVHESVSLLRWALKNGIIKP
jgi:DNA-binding NarL/FixJ family response regulator